MQTATDLRYPKRLIEVDLPIARISAHARREKSIRHGHISTLHIWWARRPLAACRAVILASLWPDPAPAEDEVPCPPAFLKAARKWMVEWAERCASKASAESSPRITAIRNDAKVLDDPLEVRGALLDFIADFANWDRSTDKDYLEISRALTQAAHEALGGKPGTRPLVVDPFAGGGSIPLEALRVGADAYASDLNPIPVLLNKVVLEYIPKYGQRLADEVRKWGQWVKEQAEKELAEFYPKDPDGATPIAYLWARTIKCEGPGCGAEVPLLRSLWLAKKGKRSLSLKMSADQLRRKVDFEIQTGTASDPAQSTITRGSATCPLCSYTTKVERVREQIRQRKGASHDARLLCVVLTKDGQSGRSYRIPTEADYLAIKKANQNLESVLTSDTSLLSLAPEEPLDVRGIRHTWAMIYGLVKWRNLFSPRQLLALTHLVQLVSDVRTRIDGPEDFKKAVVTLLALTLSKETDLTNALCRWKPDAECPVNLFGRQAIPMVWDFAEAVPISDSSGSWSSMLERTAHALDLAFFSTVSAASAAQASATNHPLRADSAEILVTDPPYYDAVPYAYLSDFFYVWLRRCLSTIQPTLFVDNLVPKDAEIVVDRPHELSNSQKNIKFYERELTKAFGEARRVVRPDGLGTIVFASKTTASWEAVLQSIIDAGWTISGSWPIDTEMESRVSAQGQARLASSVHIVCRPRESNDGSIIENAIGDWRDVLDELPGRIRSWMKRLKNEGVVGADAIFACLGPALEIFSRYSRVEKSSGDNVPLREYLEHVWATVSHEAVKMIFEGAEADSLEPNARLTTMWLWTLGAGKVEDSPAAENSDDDSADDEEEKGIKKAAGFALEFDAARMIAQGLGIHLDKSADIVRVKGDTAHLLSVAERTSYLFGKGTEANATIATARKKKEQLSLGLAVADADPAAASRGDRFSTLQIGKPGTTVLDRLHQAMILFGAGRGEALRAFLVDDGHGRDDRLWRLAQSLSALYPRGTEERRWVEGVLSRKKALGL